MYSDDITLIPEFSLEALRNISSQSNVIFNENSEKVTFNMNNNDNTKSPYDIDLSKIISKIKSCFNLKL